MTRTAPTVKHKTNSPRTDVINIRIPPRTRNLIDRAAASRGRTRSDFMLAAAQREAEDTLLDQTLFLVDAKSYKKFVDCLDNPPKNNEKLRLLMKTKSPWK